jgi:hypothetical protein
MDDGFDREFNRSRWQRVLAVGPDGIQPYVRPGHRSGPTAPWRILRRLLAIFAGLMPRAPLFGAGARSARPCGSGAAATG